MGKTINDRYLWHHGIKGQKWGVQHGPPYPLNPETSVRIKKGSKISTVTGVKKLKLESGRGMYTYDPSDEHDADIYKGAHSQFLQYMGNKHIYEKTFEASEDLLLPSHKEKINTFFELVKNDKDFKTHIDFLNKEAQERLDSTSMNYFDVILKEQVQKTRKWAESCGDVANMSYWYFMRSFDQKTLTDNHYSEKAFINALSKKGYNAMFDDNDAGRFNGAHAPLYIFDQRKSLTNQSNRKLSNREIKRSRNRLGNGYAWNEKGGSIS